jgi:ribosome-associated toxin RatA of RatAB toxin-antitoxin module
VLRIDRTVSSEVPASPSRCLALLADVEAYPSWARPVGAVEVLERRADDAPARVRLRADVFGLPVQMDCALELGGDRVVLRRVPYDADDSERYHATWRVRPRERGAIVELTVAAALDTPAPAGLLRGRVSRRLADDLLADFVLRLAG